MHRSIIFHFMILVVVYGYPCAKPDISKMSEEEQKLVSENTKKFIASITCEESRALLLFNAEKSQKGEKVALENLQIRSPTAYEKHTAYMRDVLEGLGEEGAVFFVKAESLGDQMRTEAAKGVRTTLQSLKDEYKSLSSDTRGRLESEYPIFRLEQALEIIYRLPLAEGKE